MEIHKHVETTKTISLSENDVKEAVLIFLNANNIDTKTVSMGDVVIECRYGLFDGVTVKIVQVENQQVL